jgi:hypothetical protein
MFFFGGIERAGNNRRIQSILKGCLAAPYPAAT